MMTLLPLLACLLACFVVVVGVGRSIDSISKSIDRLHCALSIDRSAAVSAAAIHNNQTWMCPTPHAVDIIVPHPIPTTINTQQHRPPLPRPPKQAMAPAAASGAAAAVGGFLRHAAHQCRRRLLGAASASVVLPALAATTTAAFTPTGRLALSLRRPRPQEREQEQEQEAAAAVQQPPLSSSSSSSWWWNGQEHEQEQGLQPALLGLGLEGLNGPLAPSDDHGEASDAPSSFIGGLWDGLLRMAVPKKKVSHRRQRRRLVRYDAENIVHAYECPACGKPKLRHRLCDDYERCAQQAPAKYRRAGGAQQEGRQQGEGEGRA